MEQRQLVGLITQRSEVRILPPLPYVHHRNSPSFEGLLSFMAIFWQHHFQLKQLRFLLRGLHLILKLLPSAAWEPHGNRYRGSTRYWHGLDALYLRVNYLLERYCSVGSGSTPLRCDTSCGAGRQATRRYGLLRISASIKYVFRFMVRLIWEYRYAVPILFDQVYIQPPRPFSK